MAREPLIDNLRYREDSLGSGRKVLPVVLAAGLGVGVGGAIQLGVFDDGWRDDVDKVLAVAESRRGLIKKESEKTLEGKTKVDQLVASCDAAMLACMGADFSNVTVHCLSESNAVKCVSNHIENRTEAKAFIDCVKGEVMGCYGGAIDR